MDPPPGHQEKWQDQPYQIWALNAVGKDDS